MSTEQPRPTRRVLGLEWPAETTAAERRTLIAGGLGWMLDAMDVMLYSMVLAELMREFGMDTRTAGLLNSLTLLASAFGGLLFGFLADRIGRTRALMGSILVYSLSSGACGLSQGVVALAVLRFLLGLGMGGEWATGAALIAETWPAEHRAKALGLMQSSWAIGEMLAVAVAGAVLPHFSWRWVFFVGVAPALVVLWIRSGVPESTAWLERRPLPPSAARDKGLLLKGCLVTATNACSMFGYWGLFTWVPGYLSLPVEKGGRGLDIIHTTAWLLLMGVGKWFGYALFGFAADAFGRRASYSGYLFVAALLVPVYGHVTSPTALLVLGPIVAFFGTGFFSGFGAIASEIFPTAIRATAMGLAYNIGRGVAAAAPLLVGALARGGNLGSAFGVLAGAFLLASLLALLLPETKGQRLDSQDGG